MNWGATNSLALVVCFYLCLHTYPVYGWGKDCGGHRHSCLGGNGKRSTPSLDLASSKQDSESAIALPRSLLSQVLLGDLTWTTDNTKQAESLPRLSSFRSFLEDRNSRMLGEDEDQTELKNLEDRQETTYRTRLALALKKLLELRKYARILERELGTSTSDLV